MNLKAATGYIDERGRFYHTRFEARKAEISEKLYELLSVQTVTYTGGGGSPGGSASVGGSVGGNGGGFVSYSITISQILANREKLIQLLNEYSKACREED